MKMFNLFERFVGEGVFYLFISKDRRCGGVERNDLNASFREVLKEAVGAFRTN